MTDLNIQSLYNLVFQGQLDKMVDEVEGLKGSDRIQGNLFKIFFFLEFGKSQPEEYRRYITTILENNPDNSSLQIIAKLHRLSYYWWIAEFSEGIPELPVIKILFEKLDPKIRADLRFYEVWFYHLAGTFYHAVGEYEKGFKAYFSGLTLIDIDPVAPQNLFTAGINLHLGNGYMKIGDYVNAEKHYMTAYNYPLESGHWTKVLAQFNLASISFIKGDIENALELHKECLALNRSINYHRGILENLNRLGLINHYLNNSVRAIEYLENAFKEAKKTELVLLVASTLANLITVYINLGDFEKAKQYYNEIEKLSKETDDHWLQSMYLSSKALIFRHMERFEGLVIAKEALKEIMENDNFHLKYRIDAILHLTDLLLMELKTFDNEEIFHEVERLSNRAFTLGKEKKLAPVEIEASILKSKLSMINGDFSIAETLLQEVYSLAQRKGLIILETRVKKEQELMNNELSKWMDLINRNSSLKERIEQSQIESYLREAIQLQNLHSGGSS